MGNNAIGASLEIPQSVLNKLDDVDKKLQGIATTADNMSKSVIASFNNIGTQGVDSLLTKINQLQGGIGSVDFGKITSGLNDTAKSAEVMADNMVKAAQAVSGVGKSDKSLSLTAEMAKVPHTVNEAIEQIKNLQKAAKDVDFNKEWKNGKAFDVVNQRINDLKANLKSMQTIKVSPQSALSMDGSSIEKRIAQNKQLTIARSQLSNTDKNYEKTLAQLNAKILENNKANAQAIAGSKELKKQRNALIDTSSQLARKLALIFSVSQITGYINNMINVRGNMELQQRSLEAILQNKTKADAIYQQITDLAVRSPFTIQELTSYTKQLAAYRIETEKLYDTTKMLADISAGLGVDMQRLILAFGQVKAANYLRGQELRQFSEAGINILGELADYFGELNNRIYSTADVFDMVSKRMVKFSDVEQVFKRLTNAGGIFYNMQEIQAETLKGQLSNLRDTLDVMFNEIGKANDGVLKDSVAFVRSLVQNWEIFADVLKLLVVPAFAAYAGYIVITTANKYKLIAANTIEITQMNALQKATIKTIASYKNLIAMMKANADSFIWGGSVTAVAAIGVGIYEWSKRVDANKAKYDELNKSIYSNLDGINASMDAMLKQSSIIDNNNKLIASNTLNEQENKNAQEQVNKATNQRNILIKKFAEEYPDYYQQIKSQLKTTDDIKAAQERLNKQMELTNSLMFTAKAQEGWFSDGFIKNMEDAEEAFSKVRLAGGDTEAAFQEMRNTVRDLAQQGKISQELKNNIEDIIKAEDTTYNKGIKLRKIIYSTTGNERPFVFAALRGVDDLIDNYISALNKSKKAVKDFGENTSEIVKRFFYEQGIYTKSQFESLSKEEQQIMLNDALAYVSNWKNSSKEVKQVIIDEFANFGLNIPISFTFETGNKEDDFLTNQINDYLQKNVGTVKLNSLGIPLASGAGKEYLEQNIAISKELRKELEQTEKATTQLNKDKTNTQRIEEIKDELKAREGLTKAVGLYNEEVVKGGTKGEDIDKSRLSLLKELKSQYDDLLKYYTQEEAAQKVYKNNKKEIVRLGLQVNEMTKYELSEYLKLLHTLKQTPDVLKEISKTETLIDVKIKEDSIKKAKDKIDNLFSGYELGVEIENQGLDKGIFGELFDIYIPDRNELKKEFDGLKEEYSSQGSEIAKIYEEGKEKMKEVDKKYYQGLIKQYTTMTASTELERMKIEKDFSDLSNYILKALAEGRISQADYDKIVQQITKGYKSALSKIDWKEFQSSADFAKAFGDTDNTSTQTLQRVLEKMRENVREAITSGDVSNVKEYVSQIEKLYNTLLDRKDPFTELKDALKDYNKALEEVNDTTNTSPDKYDNYVKALNRLDKAIDRALPIVEEFGNNLADAVGQAFGDDIGDQVRQIFKLSDAMAKAIKTLKGSDSVIQKTEEAVDKVSDAGEKSVEAIGDAVNATSDAVTTTSATAAKAISTVEKASVILAVVSAALQIMNTISDIDSQFKEEQQDMMNAIIKSQIEYNKALLETKLLHEDVFGSNPFGNIMSDIQTARDAMDEYNEAAYRQVKIWQDPKHGGLKGLWNFVGNTFGSFDVLNLGWGKWVKSASNDVGNLVTIYENGMTAAVNNLRYITQKGSKGFFGIGSKGTKTKDLRQWVKDNFGTDLFDENGLVNLTIVDELLSNHADRLTDETKETLETLKMYSEKIKEVEDNITDWATDIFGDLASNLTDSLVESFRNGEDAADDFEIHVSKILENLGNQMLQNMLYKNVFEAYQGDLEKLTKDFALGNISQNEYQTGIIKLTSDIMASADTFLGMGTDFIKNLKEKAAEKGIDIYSPTSESGELSGLQRGIQSASEETMQAVEALLNSLRFFVADSNKQLQDICQAITSTDENSNPLLAELRLQTAQIQAINKLLNSVSGNSSSTGSKGIRVYIQ